MSQKAKHQITYAEPAERPLSIDLSVGEIHALITHHEKCAKTMEKAAIQAMGQLKLKENPKMRDLDDIRKGAQRVMDAHFTRAKGLAAILHAQLES